MFLIPTKKEILFKHSRFVESKLVYTFAENKSNKVRKKSFEKRTNFGIPEIYVINVTNHIYS